MATPRLLPNLAVRLQALIDSLISHPNIDVKTAEIGPPATETQIREARRAAHGYLPPGLEEFYSQVGFFRLEWAYTGPRLDDENVHEDDLCNPKGHVNIIPITRIFGSWAGVLYFPEDGEDVEDSEDEHEDPSHRGSSDDEEEEEQNENKGDEENEEDDDDWRFQYAHLKPIDMFVPEAYTVLVGPKKKMNDKKKEKKKKPRDQDHKFSDYIAYHYCGEELLETRYTFADYVERMIVSRGYWYWAQSLCHFDRETWETEWLKNIAPLIFPDMDLRLFVP